MPTPPDAVTTGTAPADRRWDRATAAVLLLGALVIAATFRSYGAVWDEPFQSEVGRNILSWYSTRGADQRALVGGSTGNLHLYGGLFEVAAELAGDALPFDPAESRHLANALVALLGAAGAAVLARRLAGSRAAFLAAAILVTTPPWWGHGFANSKDIPFATAYAWLLIALLRFADGLPRARPRAIWGAGIALGAALAIRPGGLLVLLPITAGVVGVRLLPSLLTIGGRGRAAAMLLGAGWRLALVVALGWAVMVAFWPFGLANPIAGPAAVVAATGSFRWVGLVRFAGEWVWSTELPWSYLPRWLAATLPESWGVAAVAGLAAMAIAWRRDRVRPSLDAAWLDRALVAAAGFGPLLAAAATRPVLYDGIRHFLFVLPILAVLAGWGLSAAFGRLPRGAVGALAVATVALAALAVVDAVRLHPYQYVYFNRSIAGGLKGASLDFELDYWAAAGREAGRWVVENVRPRRDRPVVIDVSAHPYVAAHWVERDPSRRSRYAFVQGEGADLRIATTRHFAHRVTGRVLHVVERMGVPLLYVIDLAPQSPEPVVLEAGDVAVTLPAGEVWSGDAVIGAGDERAAYRLRRAGAIPAMAEVWVESPRTGGVPDLDGLRARVSAIGASLLAGGRDVNGPVALQGGAARGWMTTAVLGEGQAARLVVVAAVRVGEAAVFASVQAYGDPAAEARRLAGWLAGATLTPEEHRRRP